MSRLQSDTSWATQVELVFLGIYTVELLLRLVAGGLPIFKSNWRLEKEALKEGLSYMI